MSAVGDPAAGAHPSRGGHPGSGPDRAGDPGSDPGRAGEDRALADALRYLGRRERTTAELRRHLTARGFAAPGIEHAVASLTAQGYLDDARFARLFVEDKRALEGWGSERIVRALRERGLAGELIEAALTAEDGGELERALTVLRRRCPAPPQSDRERGRALGILLRKGYDSELACAALRVHARTGERPPMR